jgi:hypothetical protein
MKWHTIDEKPQPSGKHVLAAWKNTWNTDFTRAEMCCYKGDWWYPVRTWNKIERNDLPTHWTYIDEPN